MLSQETLVILWTLGSSTLRWENSRIWRSLGTLIRDRGNYTISNREQQYKSNLLYTTGHIATYLFFLNTENAQC
jgi:hypothetical protein